MLAYELQNNDSSQSNYILSQQIPIQHKPPHLQSTHYLSPLQLFGSKMFKLKNQRWRKEIRVSQREQIKRIQRDRVSLIEKLSHQLQIYKQCSLISGNQQLLDHRNFFDCESFAVEMNKELYRLIVAVGIQNCRSQLLQNGIASTLFSLTQTIQNKTVQQNQLQQIKHFYSRERVIDSIANILCLFTQDLQLVNQYGQYIISILATALKWESVNATAQQQWNNKIIGLQNLFQYQSYEDQTYQQLHACNMELTFQRYCIAIIDNRILPIDINVNFFGLLRKYLQYQQTYSQDVKSNSFTRTFSQVVNHIFSHQYSEYFDAFTFQFIDQFLKICEHFHFRPDISLMILKKTKVYPYLSFIQLFNSWTYHSPSISLQDFNCQQIKELLMQTHVDNYNFQKYTETLAACLVNLLQNTEDSEVETQMIWKCLQQTDSAQHFCSLQKNGLAFEQLHQLLNIYPPNDSI